MMYNIFYRDYCTSTPKSNVIVDQCDLALPIYEACELVAKFKELDQIYGTNCDYWLVPA